MLSKLISLEISSKFFDSSPPKDQPFHKDLLENNNEYIGVIIVVESQEGLRKRKSITADDAHGDQTRAHSLQDFHFIYFLPLSFSIYFSCLTNVYVPLFDLCCLSIRTFIPMLKTFFHTPIPDYGAFKACQIFICDS